MPTRTALLFRTCCILACITFCSQYCCADHPAHQFPREIQQLLKKHCIKCHGVAKRDGNLQLHTPLRVWEGGESGKVVIAGSDKNSLLWQRIEKGEMPPNSPLNPAEKMLVKQWINAGAEGLPKSEDEAQANKKDEHWAFAKLGQNSLPTVRNPSNCRTPIDVLVESELERSGLTLGPPAEPHQLLRRVTFTLTGLPPDVDQLENYVNDLRPDAYDRLIDSVLASPQFGVRWGEHWLDVAGYADSNGYFNADSDRPLAYRYRDYVIRSINCDKPFDQFVREQLAGDELAQFSANRHEAAATEQMIDQLVATHFLRNGQDGTGESDGNDDEVRIDRYTALESCQQIIASSLLGLTIQCAKCHDHKFEPITQQDYYSFQAVLFPAFNPDHWVKPNDRVIRANLPEHYQQWSNQVRDAESNLIQLRSAFRQWLNANRQSELVLFEDHFDQANELRNRWTSKIPGDDGPAGTSPVTLLEQASGDETNIRPAALVSDGKLQIVEGGIAGDKWLSTQQVFDWTPALEGEWIQVTFDLIADKVAETDSPAERIAFGLALHDYNHNSAVAGGNLLIDGNPNGGAVVDLNYPGSTAQRLGTIGEQGYTPGHSYGVRLTRLKNSRILVEQLVDFVVDGKSLDVDETNLPDGSFGFEYCCGRSFVVDNVVVECSPKPDSQEPDPHGNPTTKLSRIEAYRESLSSKQTELETARRMVDRLKDEQPGRISWVTDSTAEPPEVYLLTRGNYSEPSEKIEPSAFSALNDVDNTLQIVRPDNFPSSGRRLAWSTWVTKPDSRASHLMARVQVNRLWQHYFGVGLVSTSENLGMSGAEPTNRQLLDWLAVELIRNNWNLKSLHRLILSSTVFRQSSVANPEGLRIDPQNLLVWRYPIHRLDGEAIRDSLLAISGDLELSIGGPYVPTTRIGTAEVVVEDGHTGAARRSLFLQHRRSQGLSLLSVFDAPSIVVNCARRPVTTMPLQSLTLMNSEFAVQRGNRLAERCRRHAGDNPRDLVRTAFHLVTARLCSAEEEHDALEFFEKQRQLYSGEADAQLRGLADLCQMLLASNLFLYLE